MKKSTSRIFLLLTIPIVISAASKLNDDKDVDLFVNKANWVNPNDMINFGQTDRNVAGEKVWHY